MDEDDDSATSLQLGVSLSESHVSLHHAPHFYDATRSSMALDGSSDSGLSATSSSSALTSRSDTTSPLQVDDPSTSATAKLDSLSDISSGSSQSMIDREKRSTPLVSCERTREAHTTTETSREARRRKRKEAAPLPFALEQHIDNYPMARFTGSLRNAKTIEQRRRVEAHLNRELFPRTLGSEGLERLSRERHAPTERLDIANYCFLVTRDVERLSESNDLQSLRRASRSMERAIRRIDDTVLEHRHDEVRMRTDEKNGGIAGLVNDAANNPRLFVALDENGRDPLVLRAEQCSALWIARCKLEHALRHTLAARPSLHAMRDAHRLRAQVLTSADFARWLQHTGACDRSVLVLDAADGTAVGHRLQECGLLALWSSIKVLMSQWQRLAFDCFVLRLLQELQRRVAFFLSYSEPMSDVTQRRLDNRERRILGLALDMWAVHRSHAGDTDDDGTGADKRRSLLDAVAFVRSTGEHVFINEHFVDETERVLSSMHHELRQMAGFRWHIGRHVDAASCLACEELANFTQADRAVFERVVGEQLAGPFRQVIKESFHENVFLQYMRPSDAERFRSLNPAEVHSARNILAKEQRQLFQTLNDKYIDVPLADVWRRLCATPAEPAYSLLAKLAAGAWMREQTKGVRLGSYCVDTSRVQPFTYQAERRGEFRDLLNELYTVGVTTGTFRLRNELVHKHGLQTPVKHRHYRHPLILSHMNSTFLLYRDQMHECPMGVAQAIVCWMATMCRDRHVRGQLHNRSFLHPMWMSVCPRKTSAIAMMFEGARQAAAELSPLRRILSTRTEQAELEQRRSASGAAQF